MVEYDPFSPGAMRDPYPMYRVLREQYPVYRLAAYDGWAVARFEDVWRVLGDRDAFSVVEGPVFEPEVAAGHFDETAPAASPERSFSSWDPPAHTAFRRAIAPHFGPGVASALEADVRQLAERSLDHLLPLGRFDANTDLAGPVAAASVAPLLGLPRGGSGELVPLINRSTRREPGRPGFTEDGMAAMGEVHGFIRACVAERRAHGAGEGSLVDALLDYRHEGQPLGDDEIATQLMTLLVGGVETLPKILAGGLLQLSRHPGQREALAADVSLSAAAFEEMMRHQGVLQHVGRTALRDTEVGGRTIRRGERLFLLIQSANRDEREFADAERFDIQRRPRRHLAFGRGAHHCIGSHLARLEGRVLLETLFRRVPDYRIDEAGIELSPSDFQLGYTAMPVEV